MDKRRDWINDQISKGYMHKSCKVLIHSRAKFPFESGFDIESTRKRMKKSIPEDNLACLIRGVHVDKNGLVYPCKRRIDYSESKLTKKVISSQPTEPLPSVSTATVLEAPAIIGKRKF